MKFNVCRKSNVSTLNYEGAKAYNMSPEMELYGAVVTTSLEGATYEKSNDRLKRIQKLITKCDPVFVAQLAVYARTEMYLRSIPLVLVIELAKVHRGDSLVSNTLCKVIQRADEITEALAYYQMANQRSGTKKLNSLSKQIQKGIAKAFLKFDEYQFAKYNRKAEVTLKDALFLTHPKATGEESQQLFDKIVNDTLQVPYTWETELSSIGQQNFNSEKERKAAFTRTWESLIDSRKLGYMALMRNLRNILQANVSSDHIEKVVSQLTNEQTVLKSKQFPFRYLAAYRELHCVKSSYTSYVLDALETAIQISAKNIKGFDLRTKVLIASDVSGSMYRNISTKSKIMSYDIGLMLSMLLQYKSKNVITGIFGNTWMPYQFAKNGILQNVNALKSIEGKVGYATNGYKVIRYLNTQKEAVDKVMIFTDLQMWNSSSDGRSIQNEWKTYKKNIAPNAKLYLFDLSGYGNTPLTIEKNDVYLIAGWSDKVFDVLEALDNGQNTLSAIKKIALN
ncbi:MAG: TROVE domain-containing protein [Flavobacteriaceae bacterium]|nr:TROVE domain-containing protein [Flavobacteriaceae bacterium]